jgi:peptidoglycan/LPS O-acetylase OafA/YrhL
MATRAVNIVDTTVGPPDEARFYRPELDVLRFFAFLAVYLSHSLSIDTGDWVRYHFPEKLANLMAAVASSGRFGVQLFFLLSGYLITSLLLRERWIKGDVNLRAFYIRRILRIWPLYFFILLVAVLWPWTGRLPLPYFLAYLLLAGNWITGMFGPPTSWASILWSVSIEEQFYLSWPLVVKIFSRKRCFQVAIGLIVVANVARLYLAVGSLHSYTVFPNTFAQLDSIGAGILCAIVLKASIPLFSTGKRLLLVYSGLALLVGCGYFGKFETPTFVIAGYPAVTFGCLALFLAFCGTSLSWRPLVYLGKISYGLYVYHVLALSLVGRALGGKAGTSLRFLVYWWGGLLFTIALASASYPWLETPFLRLKEKFAVVKSRPVEGDRLRLLR